MFLKGNTLDSKSGLEFSKTDFMEVTVVSPKKSWSEKSLLNITQSIGVFSKTFQYEITISKIKVLKKEK